MMTSSNDTMVTLTLWAVPLGTMRESSHDNIVFLLTLCTITILISPDDYRIRRWSRGHCDSSDCDGIGVVWMQRECCEVSAQGDMTILISSIHFCDIYQIVLDHPIPLREKRWIPGERNAVRVTSKSGQTKGRSSRSCNLKHYNHAKSRYIHGILPSWSSCTVIGNV